jgi:hypothetical protein
VLPANIRRRAAARINRFIERIVATITAELKEETSFTRKSQGWNSTAAPPKAFAEGTASRYFLHQHRHSCLDENVALMELLKHRLDGMKIKNPFLSAGRFCQRPAGVLMSAAVFLAGCKSTSSDGPQSPVPAVGKPTAPVAMVTLTNTTYHGWTNCYVLNNETTEVIVVPRVGRVMQFGFRGEQGVFWENAELEGKELSCESKEWINFGGDKTWPAPESDWSRVTGRTRWHPPEAFDCLPLDARVEGSDVLLSSRVDPHYGVRTVRRIHLDPARPEMTIETTYERIWGLSAPIGIWIITQLKEPAAVYSRVPAAALEAMKGVILLTKNPPPTLKVEDGLAGMTRDPLAPYKLGFESSSLLWMGEKHALRIESLRIMDAEYPDKGSSAEVYTNPDPLKYVELEMLGPLRMLKPGEKMVQTNRYTLFRRTDDTLEQQARRILVQ